MLRQFEDGQQIGSQSGGQTAMKSGGGTRVTKRFCFESWRTDPGVKEREKQGAWKGTWERVYLDKQQIVTMTCEGLPQNVEGKTTDHVEWGPLL